MSLSLLSLCLALVADEPIPAEKAAVIERAQAKAQAEVSAKYGHKKSSELSQDERRQMVKDQADAEKAVLEKHGVDGKQWARESLKRDRAQYAENQQRVKDLEAKEKADEEKRKADANAPKEIAVQRGITEDSPVTLDEKPYEVGKVPIEEGLPPEAIQDLQSVAAEGGEKAPAPAVDEAPTAKPARGGKGGRGGRGR